MPSNNNNNNPGHNVLELFNFSTKYRSDSPQVKPNLRSSLTKLVYELADEMPNDSRLKILGN